MAINLNGIGEMKVWESLARETTNTAPYVIGDHTKGRDVFTMAPTEFGKRRIAGIAEVLPPDARRFGNDFKSFINS